MLAQTADGPAAALARLGTAAFEVKFDGARVQVHRAGDVVRVYTRSLRDETGALPEVVEAARALPVRDVVLDGEVIALRPDGTPRTFQETMRRFGRRLDLVVARAAVPLTPHFLDLLYLDGESWIDRPARERWEALERILPAEGRAPRPVSNDAPAATRGSWRRRSKRPTWPGAADRRGSR